MRNYYIDRVHDRHIPVSILQRALISGYKIHQVKIHRSQYKRIYPNYYEYKYLQFSLDFAIVMANNMYFHTRRNRHNRMIPVKT